MAKRHQHRLLRFVELPGFHRTWRLAGLGDGELNELQWQLAVRPQAGVTVSGTGGLRKLRFVPQAEGRGKSGAYRVGYVFCDAAGTVILIVVYPKNVKATISAAEKKQIKGLVEAAVKRYCHED